MRAACLTVLSLVAAFTAAGAAARGHGGQLTLGGVFDGGQRNAWVEQQDDWPRPADGGITNPMLGDCNWAVNEHSDFRRVGPLDPDQQASGSNCVVSDFNPVTATRNGVTGAWSMAAYGFTGVFVYSDRAVTVTICFEPQGRCFTGTPTWDQSQRVYQQAVCARASYSPDDPALQDIEGSNGGRGVVTMVTVTVTNTGGRRARTVDVRGGFSSDVFFPQGCAGPQQAQHDYPFSWTTG